MIKNKIGHLFSNSFDIPLESLSEIPNAQFIGNKLLHIDGCIGVKKYERTNIIIKCKKHILTVSGKELSMITFSLGRVSIRGFISSYQIEETE
ncbi:MAG: YabP/YqfC family sporulation protein [Clostridia bacterium]|nr:YabP/YqfC family sporulation protein [Clostridia bacterium]